MRVRSILTIVAGATLLAGLGAAPAQADDVRTLTGPSTGDPDLFLTFVGCGDLFAPATAPQSRLNLGPYDAPLGRRSLGLVPSAPGTASGPFARFDSLAGLDASVAVASTSGTEGVSYVMSITPSNAPGTAWSGRAPLTAPPGSWTQVSTAALTYDWTLVDLTTLAPFSPGAPVTQATPAAFAAEHGDGAGFAVTGFGCDGRSFNLDAVRSGGSTFDFEGVALATTASADAVRPGKDGDHVTLTGRVSDTGGRVTGDPLVLESRTPGGTWSPVGEAVMADPSGTSRVDVPVTETTEFRWHRPESQYADEGWSDPVTVTVEQPPPAPAPDPSKDPAPDPSKDPAPDPSKDTSPDPSKDESNAPSNAQETAPATK